MNGTARQRGQVLPLAAICLLVLFGIAALAVDAGYLQYKQRLQQTAADSAALAAAWQIARNQSSTAVTSAGQSAAASNGFTDGSSNVAVTINWPPKSGPNTNYASAVEAIVQAKYPPIFSGVMGWTHNDVSTRAVAVVRGNPSAACIYILQKNFNVSNGTLTGSCGALVENDVQANSKTVWNIPFIGAGGHIMSPPANASVSTGIGSVQDPCASVPGCTALKQMYPLGSSVQSEGLYSTCGPAPATTVTLSPSCYTSVNGTYHVSPGLIVISGDLTGSLICAAADGCDGTKGVTVVVGGKVNLNGSTTNLTSPPAVPGATTASVTTSGAPGVVLYQVGTSTAPENFSAQELLGMVYAPNAHVNQNAGSSLTVDFLIVADFVTNGNTITVNNPSNPYTPYQAPILAE